MPVSPAQASLLEHGFALMVPFWTLREPDFVPPRWRRKSTKSTHSYRSSHKTQLGSKTASRRLLRQWLPRRQRLLILSKSLEVYWLASLLWKQMQPLDLRALIQRDPGTYSDEVTAPQPLGPLGPMALDHPMTTEIQYVHLTHLQALKVNRHEVPFFYDSNASNTLLGLRSGSIALWKSQTFQHITSQSQFIAKQVPYRARLVFEKKEPCARNS